MTDSAGRVHRGLLVEERSEAWPQLVTRSIVDPEAGLLYSRLSAGLPLERVRREWGPGELEALLSGEAGAPVPAPALDVLSLGIPLDGVPPWKNGGAGVREARLRISGGGTPLLEERLREAARDLGEGSGAGVPGGTPLEVRRQGEALEVRLRAPRLPAPEDAPRPGALSPAAGAWTGGGFYLDLDDPRLDGLLAGARQAGRLIGRAQRPGVPGIRLKSTRLGFAGTRRGAGQPRRGTAPSTPCCWPPCCAGRVSGARGLRVRALGDRVQRPCLDRGLADGRWQWLDPSFPGEEGRRLKLRLGVLDPARPLRGNRVPLLPWPAGCGRRSWRGRNERRSLRMSRRPGGVDAAAS